MRPLPFALFLLVSVAVAQQPPTPPNLEPVPDGAPTEAQESLQQPEVTIRRRPEDTIKEYRANGSLYMIQVIPNKGVPYFLVDTDGDGNLETRYNDLSNGIMVPAWVILSW